MEKLQHKAYPSSKLKITGIYNEGRFNYKERLNEYNFSKALHRCILHPNHLPRNTHCNFFRRLAFDGQADGCMNGI